MNEKLLFIQENPHYLTTFLEKTITYIDLIKVFLLHQKVNFLHV